MDERAQSIGIARLFLSLAVGAIVYFILETVTDPILDRAGNATSNATANQATAWLRQGIDYAPAAIAMLTFISLVVLAIYQREIRS